MQPSLRSIALMMLLAFLSGGDLLSQQQPRERTISTRGTGIVRVVPDYLRVPVQINVPRAENAVGALERNSQLTAAVLSSLKRLGIADHDILTTRVTVSPVYDHDKRISPPPIVGYTAQNEIVVVIRKIEDAGRILDQAVKAGATGFGSLTFESSQKSQLEREALRKAAEDARQRAEVLAGQLGASVGNVMFIGETGLGIPDPRPKMMGLDARASMDVPVMTGQIEITAIVEVLFELK